MITTAAPAHASIPAPRTALPPAERLAEHVREVDHLGYTVIPGFLDRDSCARLREHIDALIARKPESRRGRTNHLRHPIPGAIMAWALTSDHLAIARALLRCDGGLRLIEQVMMRTDPGAEEPARWHIDGVLYPRHHLARPRQTYHFLWQVLDDLEPSGGGTMIVPYSQHLAYAAAARIADPIEPFPPLHPELGKRITATAGFDTRQAVELTGRAGDLIILDPTCLHTASSNRSDRARYVLQQCFCHESSTEMLEWLRTTYAFRDPFSEDLRANLPAEWLPLLER
jgi:ectoine hydroxylase-related dioxygenase (phytanoyl-CoA dioxygenase family)